ncbi:hypothetical protein ABT340_39215 [Streptosporangium sp. NPDC000239]|uniref:hypothetical protein n=1 Tax=Streptosporangium sp. NPDC000239 TaxID=3154248 RepID=UPI003322A127
MSTRKSVAVAATAALAWLGAAGIAITYADIHKLFILLVAAAAVLTVSPRSHGSAPTSTDAAAAVSVPAAAVEAAHQLGIAQGVRLAKMQESPEMLSVESFFFTPPN